MALLALAVVTAPDVHADDSLEGSGEPSHFTVDPVDVTIDGRSESDALRTSARAVHVIDTDTAQERTADMGEVLARSQGVGVQRGGGLGSTARLSLGGLSGDQVRIFVDGVPLEMAGYPLGLANVPVDQIAAIDVYRGVVPIAFGADALGGAINLRSEPISAGTGATASYQGGSFDTHRLALSAHAAGGRRGGFVRTSAYLDRAENDYLVTVDVPDDQGRLATARVRRFHDGYAAQGVNVEAGVADRWWADRLTFRGYVASADKELQHNAVMTVPYGEAEYGALDAGGSVRLEAPLTAFADVDAVVGYGFGRVRFEDLGECVYDWFGRCVRERRQPGELEGRPRDQILREHGAYGRLNVAWEPAPNHRLEFSAAPTFSTRSGEERRPLDPDARDPLAAQRDLLTLVSGAAHTATLFGDVVENVVFAKAYTQRAWSDEPLPSGEIAERDRTTHRAGVGDALRVRLNEHLYAKASWELATRLPTADEVFGDGVLVVANLGLAPETSHNVNAGLTLADVPSSAGSWRADLNGFMRETDRLIVLLGNDRVFRYQNVLRARAVGVEASAGWTSPGEWVAFDGNVTWLDFRNASSGGTFGDFEGDRIPNRPYLFANGEARFAVKEVAVPGDVLSLAWSSRYVHGFYRGWESIGLRTFKQTVPSQLSHTVAATYRVDGDPASLSLTGELQNVTDARTFDFFGVQRPGRAAFFKLTASY